MGVVSIFIFLSIVHLVRPSCLRNDTTVRNFPTINIAITSDDLSLLVGNLVKHLVEGYFDVTVTLTIVSGYLLSFGANADIVLEVWPDDNSTRNGYDSYGPLSDIRIGWYTPTYVLDRGKCPECGIWTSYKNSNNIYKPKQLTILEDLFYAYDSDIIQSLGLKLNISNYSSKNIDTTQYFEDAFTQKIPILVKLYEPNPIFAQYSFQRLSLPAYTDACYASPLKYCDYPNDAIQKYVSSKFAASKPDIVGFLSDIYIPNYDLSTMLGKIVYESKREETVACDWVKDNVISISSWIVKPNTTAVAISVTSNSNSNQALSNKKVMMAVCSGILLVCTIFVIRATYYFRRPETKKTNSNKGVTRLWKQEAPTLVEHGKHTTTQEVQVWKHIYEFLDTTPGIHLESRLKRWWDAYLLVVILIHGFIVTLNLVMNQEVFALELPVDTFITITHIIDIAIGMNLAPHLDSKSQMRYNRGHLSLDIISALPIDMILYLMPCDWRFYACSRCIRLLKIHRTKTIFLISNPGALTGTYVEFFFHYAPILMGLFWCVVVLHALALIKNVIAPASESYGMSLYWIWSNLTGVEQALAQEIESRAHPREIFFTGILGIFTVLSQSLVISKISVHLLKSDVNDTAKRAMTETLSILRHYNIPPVLEQEVLSYLYHTLHNNVKSTTSVLEQLPVRMQDRIGIYIRIDIISHVPMFKTIPIECKFKLANCLTLKVLEPDTMIVRYGDIGHEMYFLMHGYADIILENGVVVKTMKSGDFFGEIALCVPDAKRTASVKALTFCNILVLEKSDLDDICQQDTEFASIMRSEAERRIEETQMRKKRASVAPLPNEPNNAETGPTKPPPLSRPSSSKSRDSKIVPETLLVNVESPHEKQDHHDIEIMDADSKMHIPNLNPAMKATSVVSTTTPGEDESHLNVEKFPSFTNTNIPHNALASIEQRLAQLERTVQALSHIKPDTPNLAFTHQNHHQTHQTQHQPAHHNTMMASFPSAFRISPLVLDGRSHVNRTRVDRVERRSSGDELF